MSEIILNGLSVDELISQIDSLIVSRINAAMEKLKADETHKLLSIEETCCLFVPKITRQTLHNWTSQGLIKSHTIGRSVFYKYSDIIDAAKPLNKIVRPELKVA